MKSRLFAAIVACLLGIGASGCATFGGYSYTNPKPPPADDKTIGEKVTEAGETAAGVLGAWILGGLSQGSYHSSL